MKKSSIKGFSIFITILTSIFLFSIVMNKDALKINFIKQSGDSKVLNNLNLILTNNIYNGENNIFTESKYTRNAYLIRSDKLLELKENINESNGISFRRSNNIFIPDNEKNFSIEISIGLNPKNNKKEINIYEDNKHTSVSVKENTHLYDDIVSASSEKKVEEDNIKILNITRDNNKIYTLVKFLNSKKNISKTENTYNLYLLEINEKNKSYKVISKLNQTYPKKIYQERAMFAFGKYLHYYKSEDKSLINIIDLKNGEVKTEQVNESDAKKDGYKSISTIDDIYSFFDEKENKLINVEYNFDDNQYYLNRFGLVDGKLKFMRRNATGIFEKDEKFYISKKGEVKKEENSYLDSNITKNAGDTIDSQNAENIMRSEKYLIFYQIKTFIVKRDNQEFNSNGYNTLYIYDMEKNELVYTGILKGGNREVGDTIYVSNKE
ncbi:hypothetical protein [Peptostreptococcus faecalis]|uniref:hypothetical protein n=1 Tax=Peptostreptococcus faecalis TaxID=2045015 RepID=UPI000C7D7E8C|nr:hypothetical protein [Peptostreptococcus faecalis]